MRWCCLSCFLLKAYGPDPSVVVGALDRSCSLTVPEEDTVGPGITLFRRGILGSSHDLGPVFSANATMRYYTQYVRLTMALSGWVECHREHVWLVKNVTCNGCSEGPEPHA